MTLDGEDIEAIAERVAAKLIAMQPSVGIGLVDAGEIAKRFGVHKSWVYAHQRELGAIRLGEGPKARLRFDLEQVARAIARDEALDTSRTSPGRPHRGRPKSNGLPTGVKLIQGRSRL